MTPALACNGNKQTRFMKAKRNPMKMARPLQVVIFTPLDAGVNGGIDRMMDELRGALQIDRFANIKRHLYSGGALPDTIEHERTRLIVKPGDVEGFALLHWVAPLTVQI